MAEIVDIQSGVEPGFLGPRGSAILDRAFQRGCSPFMALVAGTAVNHRWRTEGEFWDAVLGPLARDDGFEEGLRREVEHNLRRLNAWPFEDAE